MSVDNFHMLVASTPSRERRTEFVSDLEAAVKTEEQSCCVLLLFWMIGIDGIAEDMNMIKPICVMWIMCLLKGMSYCDNRLVAAISNVTE